MLRCRVCFVTIFQSSNFPVFFDFWQANKYRCKQHRHNTSHTIPNYIRQQIEMTVAAFHTRETFFGCDAVGGNKNVELIAWPAKRIIFIFIYIFNKT